jgi:xanthine/uracil permease
MQSKEPHCAFAAKVAAAVLLALIVVGMYAPSAGRVVLDRSVIPPKATFVHGIRETIGIWSFGAICVIGIVVSAKRKWDFEIVGWVILATSLIVGILGS